MSPAVSEGTHTAAVILGSSPESLDELYRYPRTMEEAFGPGQRTLDEDREPMHPADEVVLKASAGGFAVLLLLSSAGVLP